MNTSIFRRTVLAAAFGLACSSAFALSWPSTWTADKGNNPSPDTNGCAKMPSSTSTSTSESFTFGLSCSTTKQYQRAEWKYERRSGYHKMTGDFTVSPTYNDFAKISIAQTHDDSTGSSGVFTIYGVTKKNGKYYFGYQTDNKGWSEVAEISLGKTYTLSISTNSKKSAYESASLYESGSSTAIKTIETTSGGESTQYKKIGAYKLTNGKGPISVTWSNVKFYTGK